jgi:hypothetical protein
MLPSFKTATIAASAAVLLGFFLISHTSAQRGSVEVRIHPESQQVEVGGTIDYAVEILGVQDLYAFDIVVSFDPQVVEVVDLDPDLDGVQLSLGELMEPGFVLLNDGYYEEGRMRLAMTQLNPTEPKDGDGPLMVFRLEGLQENPAIDLAIEEVQLSTNTGAEIDVDTVSDGQVEVVANVTLATNTPLPTKKPGTPIPTRTPLPPTRTPGPTPTGTRVTPTRLPDSLPTTGIPTNTLAASPTRPSETPTQTAESVQESPAAAQSAEEEQGDELIAGEATPTYSSQINQPTTTPIGYKEPTDSEGGLGRLVSGAAIFGAAGLAGIAVILLIGAGVVIFLLIRRSNGGESIDSGE